MKNNNYDQFYALIDLYPRLSGFWDRNKHCMLDGDLENELGVLSSGEAAMAQFFATVWRWNNHDDDLDFDIVGSWSKLGREERLIVAKWLNAPFYPQPFLSTLYS